MKPPAAASGGRSAYDLILPLPIEGQAFNGDPKAADSSPKGRAKTTPQALRASSPHKGSRGILRQHRASLVQREVSAKLTEGLFYHTFSLPRNKPDRSRGVSHFGGYIRRFWACRPWLASASLRPPYPKSSKYFTPKCAKQFFRSGFLLRRGIDRR